MVDTPDDALFELRLKTLLQAIALLSPQKKAAFTLCKIQDKTYEEAARQLGISVNMLIIIKHQ